MRNATDEELMLAYAAGDPAAFDMLYARRRWRTPVALAATVLLAIGVALRVHKSTETKMMARLNSVTGQSDQQGTVGQYAAQEPRPFPRRSICSGSRERRYTTAGQLGPASPTGKKE